MTQKKRRWRHQRQQIHNAMQPLDQYQRSISESITRTENARSYVVESMKTLSASLGARGERLREGIQSLAMPSRGGNREAMPETIPPWRQAMPETIPPWLPQYYVNQHVECSNDQTNWHDATVTRIDPDAHELEVREWYDQVPGLRFIRPVQGPLKKPRYR